MTQWKTVGVRLSETELATLNQRLVQSGFKSLGELVRAYTIGLIDNGHLVDPLADKIADRIVNKLLASTDNVISQRVISPDSDGMKRAVVVQSGLVADATPKGHQPSKLVTWVQIPATAP